MERECPRLVTSRRRIKYRKSEWRVHEFEVWSGDTIMRCAALRMQDSLLLWIGGCEPYLEQAALGFPGRAGDATTLLGTETNTLGMARRLAAALQRPVYVCCGVSFDRFTMPLLERALRTQIKSRPECF